MVSSTAAVFSCSSRPETVDFFPVLLGCRVHGVLYLRRRGIFTQSTSGVLSASYRGLSVDVGRLASSAECRTDSTVILFFECSSSSSITLSLFWWMDFLADLRRQANPTDGVKILLTKLSRWRVLHRVVSNRPCACFTDWCRTASGRVCFIARCRTVPGAPRAGGDPRRLQVRRCNAREAQLLMRRHVHITPRQQVNLAA